MNNPTFPFAVYVHKEAEAAPSMNVLNTLINVCVDSAKGFQNAAEAVDLDELRFVFQEHANQREKFAEYLTTFALDLGGEIDPDGTLKGTVHRVWMDLRSALDSGNPATLLEEAVRGERAALDAFEDADIAVLPGPIQEAIAEQRLAIEHAMRRLQDVARVYAD